MKKSRRIKINFIKLCIDQKFTGVTKTRNFDVNVNMDCTVQIITAV